MLAPLILIPAYGRKYSTREAMVADWEYEHDFRIYGGPYCSIRDLNKLTRGTSSITIVDPLSRVSANVWNYFTIL